MIIPRCRGFTIKKIADLCKVTLATVKNMLYRFKQDGFMTVFLAPQRRPGKHRLLAEDHLTYIRQVIRFHEGDIAVREVRDALRGQFTELANISTSTVQRAMRHKLGLSFKKAIPRCARALAADRPVAASAHLSTLQTLRLETHEFWSIDETAIWTNMQRNLRWGQRGAKLTYIKGGQTKKYSLLLAISSVGGMSVK